MNIGGIVKNSFVDYPGKICYTIFTNGCNINCWYCHNKHLLKNNVSVISESEVLNFLTSHKPFLDAVTISGGEPTLQKDLPEFIRKIKNLGYEVKLDTNGTNFNVLESLIKQNLLDFVSVDIKAPLDSYNKISENCNVGEIEKSINLLKQNLVNYEFRTTISPNLTLEDIEKISKTIKGAKNYSLQQYRPVSEDDSLKGTSFSNNFLLQPLDGTFINKAKQIALKYLKNVVVKGL